MMMMGNQNPNLFTAAQWEELEQQALIYKYIISGVQVPTDLILSVRRSLYQHNFSSSSSLSNQQPTFGGGGGGVWEAGGMSCFPYNHHQLYQIGGGGGRKIDLEPGRCRRTDGKKWRCAKEAYPDSKYCERHMHRGRNRSRKPVESSFPTSSSSSSSAHTTHVSSSPSTKSISLLSEAYPPFTSLQTNFMDSSSFSSKDYRNLQGMKDLGENDHQRSAYFQLNDPYTTTTQKMSSGQNYSQFNFQNLKDDQQKKEEETHCFVMGTDFIKPSEEEEESDSITKVDKTSSKQPFHHFFSPTNPNHDPNWVEKAPLSTQDLFQSKPRPYW